MKSHVAEQIKTTVNGKIDRIGTKLDNFVEGDKAWKLTAQPVIDMGTNLRGFGKVAAGIIAICAAIGGAWTVLSRFLPIPR